MIQYKRIYLDYWGYGEQDYVPSEFSGLRATEIHHLLPKSLGGKDEIENLIALTREEHEEAHANPVFNKKLKEKHLIYINYGSNNHISRSRI